MKMPGANADRTRILVVTDGRAANITQAVGLAEAMATCMPSVIETAIVALRPGLSALPNRCLHLLGARAFTSMPQSRPQLAIGAGRRGNLAAAFLARHGARAVAVLRPHLPLSAFSAVVVPAHDRLNGNRVLTTLGALNRLTPAILEEAQMPFPDRPAPRLAAMIGGPSRSARFDEAALLADLGRFAGWSVLATPSRRTPPGLADRIRAAHPGIWLWDGTGSNPYPGLLTAADAILITSDSVNMASEAASTGKPVFVSGAPSQGKNAAFHADIAAYGATRPAEQAPAPWHYPPLHEAARIAPLLLKRLGFAQSDGAAYRDD